MALYSENSKVDSNQSATEVFRRSIGASTTSKTLLEARERKGFTVFNHSPVALYVDFGSSVSVSDFAVRIAPGGFWEPAINTALEVRGVWETASKGKALVRELI